jgi:hypothetical protein
MSYERWFISFLIALMAIGFAFIIGNMPSKPIQVGKNSRPPSAFNEVKAGNDGDLITLTDAIDIKYLCNDVTDNQREICTTALTRSDNNRVYSQTIKLRVCSEMRRKSCIVVEPRSDLKDIYVLDSKGEKFDFIGLKLIQPSNAWTMDWKKLKITGRVSIVNGEGTLLEPIEKIETP